MTEQKKRLYGLELTDAQCLEVSELMAELKEAGLLLNKENIGMFMTHCFYRGFMDYKKDITTYDD